MAGTWLSGSCKDSRFKREDLTENYKEPPKSKKKKAVVLKMVEFCSHQGGNFAVTKFCRDGVMKSASFWNPSGFKPNINEHSF